MIRYRLVFAGASVAPSLVGASVAPSLLIMMSRIVPEGNSLMKLRFGYNTFGSKLWNRERRLTCGSHLAVGGRSILVGTGSESLVTLGKRKLHIAYIPGIA